MVYTYLCMLYCWNLINIFKCLPGHSLTTVLSLHHTTDELVLRVGIQPKITALLMLNSKRLNCQVRICVVYLIFVYPTALVVLLVHTGV